MYVHYKSSFRDDGTKTRWIVNINVRVKRNVGEEDYEDIQIREVRMCMGPFLLWSSVPCRLAVSIQRKRPGGENTHCQFCPTVHESFLYCLLSFQTG